MRTVSRIMISYRRLTSSGIAGRIFDRLTAHFGTDSVFIDYDAIPFGVDFHEYIANTLKAVDCLVVVIGPQWLGPLAGGDARIADPADPVRIELETAVANGVRIVPVLVEGADMPARELLPESLRDLPFLNAATVDSGIDFHVHVERLIRSLESRERSRETTGDSHSVVARNNVPKRLTALIGRANEVATIESLLELASLVTITGAGGIGKTRIALHVAADVQRAYGDGVWFVDLAPLRAAEGVPDEIASVLGLKVSPERPALQAIVEHLRHRRVLLTIDNCEHVIGYVAIALDAILRSCPDVQVLATSREPIEIDGERVFRLPPLSVPAEAELAPALEFGAVALFAERATAANPDFVFNDTSASIVSDICRRLDGIPLAIELAAARASVFGVNEIRDRLDERFRMLTQGRRTALPRQQTMRATIDWSYDLLDEPKRRLFRRLAIFANGFTLASAVAIGSGEGLREADLEDDVASLVAKSLVLAEHDGNAARYRFLESTREYALEKLDESGERDEVALRFAEWCLAFVASAHALWETAPTKRWSADVKPEFENLRWSLIWSLEDRNDLALGRQIAGDARRLWGRIAPAEGQRWLRLAVDSIDVETPPGMVTALWLGDAHVHTALQEYKRAFESAERARAGYDAAQETLGYWEACGFAGCALAMLGRVEEAEPLLEQTVAAYRRHGAHQLTAGGLVDLAFLKLARDDVAAARRLFEDALVLFQDVENERGTASVAMNLAEIEFRAGNIEAAISYGEAALNGSDEERISIYLVNMAAYLIAAGDWERALERARESIVRHGIARTAMDTAYVLQHFAAVSALRPARSESVSETDRNRAARLVGYVDATLASLESSREVMEQREYDRLVGVLRESLGDRAYARLHAEGEAWSESKALAEAKLV